VFFGNLVLLPLWLQQWMGYTATQAGMALAPVGVCAILLSPWVGRNVGRFDARWFATISFATFAVVMWMRSGFNTDADFRTIMIPTILQGVAVAFFFIPLTTLILSGLSPDRIPAASGLSNFLRITAGALGTSISTTLWDSRSTLHHAQLVEHLTPGDPATTHALDLMARSGMTAEQSLAALNRLVNEQAYMLGANDIFYASAVLMLLLIGLAWLARPARGTAADAGGAH
jgi:DHA2 family multidrug resistance protein